MTKLGVEWSRVMTMQRLDQDAHLLHDVVDVRRLHELYFSFLGNLRLITDSRRVRSRDDGNQVLLGGDREAPRTRLYLTTVRSRCRKRTLLTLTASPIRASKSPTANPYGQILSITHVLRLSYWYPISVSLLQAKRFMLSVIRSSISWIQTSSVKRG